MSEMRKIRSVKDLKVYNSAYKHALRIFDLTRKFSKEETYSLTNQIRRSSRSVAINIREGFAKKRYEQVFLRHLTDSLGSSEETRGWLDFSYDFGYLTNNQHQEIDKQYDGINAMLYRLIQNWHS